MSISSKPNQPEEEITRDRLIKKSSIKRVLEKAGVFFSLDPTNFLMVMCFLVTAVGELFGREFSWKWYIFLVIITAVFFLDKFKILEKPEVIISADKPNSID